MMRTLIGLLVVVLGLLVPAVARAQSEQVFYYYEDATGSVRMITDATGQAVEWHDYQPFGEETLNNPQTPEHRLYTGKERDSETNYDYSMARYYAGINGRFTTVDPGHVAGARRCHPDDLVGRLGRAFDGARSALGCGHRSRRHRRPA